MWNEKEIDFIVRKSKTMTVSQICDTMGKSEVTVRMMARKLNIALKPDKPVRKIVAPTFVAMSSNDPDIASLQ